MILGKTRWYEDNWLALNDISLPFAQLKTTAQEHKHAVWVPSSDRYSIHPSSFPLYFQLPPHLLATFSISIFSSACFLPFQSPTPAYLPLFQSRMLGLIRYPSAAPHHLRPLSLTIPLSLCLSLHFFTAVRLKVLTQWILLWRRHYGLWPDSGSGGIWYSLFFFLFLQRLFSEKAISLSTFSMANGTTAAISQACDIQALALFWYLLYTNRESECTPCQSGWFNKYTHTHAQISNLL